MTPLVPNVGSVKKLATAVMAALGEFTVESRVQIERMIRFRGGQFVVDLVHQAEEVEANGGLMCVHRGEKRRRTLGGVFFFLAQQAIDPSLRAKVFPSVEVRDARWKRREEKKRLRKEERARALAEAALKGAESAQATEAEPKPSAGVPSPSKSNAKAPRASLPKSAPQPSLPKPPLQTVTLPKPTPSKASSPELKPPFLSPKQETPSGASRGPSRGRRREAPKLPEVFVSVRTK